MPLFSATLKIEEIGNARLGARPAWVDWIRGFYAHGFVKERLHGQRNYENANSVGSRGVFTYYFLAEGELYHVSSPRTWKHTDQYFCRVEDGQIIEITFEEVVSCLRKRISERTYIRHP